MNLIGNAQYAVNVPTGYETEPSSLVNSIVLTDITASDRASLIEAIKKQIESKLPAGAVVNVTVADNITLGNTLTSYTVTVKVQFGYITTTATKTVKAKK